MDFKLACIAGVIEQLYDNRATLIGLNTKNSYDLRHDKMFDFMSKSLD